MKWTEVCFLCRLPVPDVQTDAQMQTHHYASFFFFPFEIYVEVRIICCIYPNMSKNYFISHMKNRRSPYNCTQRYNTFCVGIFLKLLWRRGSSYIWISNIFCLLCLILETSFNGHSFISQGTFSCLWLFFVILVNLLHFIEPQFLRCSVQSRLFLSIFEV